MLDINLIISDTKHVHDALLKKGFDVDFTPLIKLYDERKTLILKSDELKTKKNKLSASVPMVKKQGGDIEAIFAEVKALKILKSMMKNLPKLKKISLTFYLHFQICQMMICFLEKKRTIKL